MTDLFSVLAIGSIITSHTLIFRKYRKKKKFHGRTTKIDWDKNQKTKHFTLVLKKLVNGSCKSNSLKFHPVKWKNYKSPK